MRTSSNSSMTAHRAGPHIFVSHATPDREVASAVCAKLESAQLRCWVSFRDAIVGEPYADTIIQALNKSRAIVLILSRSAMALVHVFREIERGCAKNCKVMTLRLDDSPLSLGFEYFLSQSHWLNAFANGLDGALEELVGVITSDRLLSGELITHTADVEPSMLPVLWSWLDPGLQEAFSIAYNKKLSEGSRRISTRDFFQALTQIDDLPIRQLLEVMPDAAMPSPSKLNVNRTQHAIEDPPLLSNCLSESLYRFGRLVAVPRKVSSIDVFVDVAVSGHGPSVQQLQRAGFGPARVIDAVESLGIQIITP